MHRKASLALVAASIFVLSGGVPAMAGEPAAIHASNATLTKQQELLREAQATAQRFNDDQSIEWVRRNVGSVKGVFIVPEQVKGAFMIGGSGGSGVLLTHRPGKDWSYPAFYTMGSLSFGFQAGGEVSELVLLVMTNKGLNAFKNTSVKLGADVSVAAGPVGAGAKAATADILAFSRQKGLYGGISVEGAVIGARNEWNEAYYGKALTPAQIIFGKKVSNPDADPLRHAVAALFTSPPAGTKQESGL